MEKSVRDEKSRPIGKKEVTREETIAYFEKYESTPDDFRDLYFIRNLFRDCSCHRN